MGLYLIVGEYSREVVGLFKGKKKDAEKLANEFGVGSSCIKLPQDIVEKIKCLG